MNRTSALGDLTALARRLDGSLVLPGDDQYATFRKPLVCLLPEVMPMAVVQCASPGDVAAAVTFARERRLPFAVRGGGHSFADYSSTEGLLIDLGRLSTVSFEAGVVTVGGGTRIGWLADQLAEHDRIVPCGWWPTVGVAGAVLGGGYGIRGRRYGLGCDHLVAAQVVLADGEVMWTDANREPELFWALRGAGGGNYGVVTALALRTHPARRVATFVHRWRWRDAVRVIEAWQRWAPWTPDEVNAELVLSSGHGPNADPEVVLFGAVDGSSAGEARPLLESFPGLDAELGEVCELSAQVAARHHTYAGTPIPTIIAPPPPLSSPPRLRMVKSEFFVRQLPHAAVEELVGTFANSRQPGQYREIELVPWGGAFGRVAADSTAFVHRHPNFMIGHHACVLQGATEQAMREAAGWLRRSWHTVRRWGTGGVYPNYPDRDLAGWAEAYYGANLPRLRRVKSIYDPQEVFRFAQSVRPV